MLENVRKIEFFGFRAHFVRQKKKTSLFPVGGQKT